MNLNLFESESTKRFPTLVQLCQRVAACHADQITCLGDDLTYPLVKPLLDRCDAEQLLRLEQSSPHLQKDTPEIWKDLCYSAFPLAVGRHFSSTDGEITSWRDQYFALRDSEARRLEEASVRLRNQRLEAAEQKKKREIKIAIHPPVPPKRQKTWGMPSQSKTLFQKTRSDVSKLTKGIYHPRFIPKMPNATTHRVLPKPPDATLAFSPAPGDATRVTVNTVIHRRPATASASSTSTIRPPPKATPIPMPALNTQNTISITKSPTKPGAVAPPKSQIEPGASSSTEPPPVVKRHSPTKRDPMAALFVPKHRAYSQRPCP